MAVRLLNALARYPRFATQRSDAAPARVWQRCLVGHALARKNALGAHPSADPVAPSAPARDDANAIDLKLDDFYDLLSKVLAAQQPKKPFGHALDPIQHIFLEFDLSRAMPIGKSL